jgi:hypothetical protein
MKPGDEKDPKRARVVLSKGRVVVRPSYLRLSGAAAEVMHKGENLGNPNLSKWFYDTSTGAAVGAARCGSFVGNAFSFLVVSSR